MVAESIATGAVVVGRKTFEYAGHWGGDRHGVPIFVPTRGTPPQPESGWVHYVADAGTAMREAKAAAGDRNVMVHGADLAQRRLSRPSRTAVTHRCVEVGKCDVVTPHHHHHHLDPPARVPRVNADRPVLFGVHSDDGPREDEVRLVGQSPNGDRRTTATGLLSGQPHLDH